MSTRTCSATRADGAPCSAPATAEGLCFAHSPALRERTAQARRTGGRNRSSLVRAERMLPDDMRGVLDRLLQAMEKVHQGVLKPAQGQALARLAATYVQARDSVAYEQLIELEDIARRLDRGSA